MRTKNRLDMQVARRLFVCDFETGILRWAGSQDEAGVVQHDGYRAVDVDGVWYRAHHIVWALATGEWPADQIDHRNGLRDDNRKANLREASQSQNNRNRRQPKSAKWLKGVSVRGKKRPWRATIRVNGKHVELGSFETEQAAHAAYCAAARRLHGEFANVG